MTGAGLTPFLAPALSAALADWLDQIRALQGAAPNTVESYSRDVSRYLAFLADHQGGAEGLARLAATSQSDLRAWSAWERARGLSPRSLARALSAVKGFTAWAADRTGSDATTVLSARAPKYRRKLPRPLSEDGRVSNSTMSGCCVTPSCPNNTCTLAYRQMSCSLLNPNPYASSVILRIHAQRAGAS